MKHFLTFLFALVAMPLLALEPNQNLISSEIIIIKGKKPEDNKRPKMPSRQRIQCIYQDGQLSFSFTVPEGECQLTVTDMTTGFARQYVFDSSAEASVNVGTLTQAHIEISTANGHEYEGFMNL